MQNFTKQLITEDYRKNFCQTKLLTILMGIISFLDTV